MSSTDLKNPVKCLIKIDLKTLRLSKAFNLTIKNNINYQIKIMYNPSV